jgi:TolA-binding protein
MKTLFISVLQSFYAVTLAFTLQASSLAQSASPTSNLLNAASGQATSTRETPAQPSERTPADIDAQLQDMQKRLAVTQADIVKAQAVITDGGSAQVT